MLSRLLFTLALSLTVVGPGWTKGLEMPPPVTAETAAAFVAAQDQADRVDLLNWIGGDLKHDDLNPGFSGTVLYCDEYVVLARSVVTESSVVVVYKSPTYQLKRVEITVDGAAGHRRWREKDLRWVTSTNWGNGVATLDGVVATAFVPGVTVGDRMRIELEYHLSGIRGILTQQLGKSEVPCMTSSYELRLPADYDLQWQIQGSPFSRDRLEFTTDVDGEAGHYRWRISTQPDGKMAECRSQYPYVQVVPQVVGLGAAGDPDWSYGDSWSRAGEDYLARIAGVFDVNQEMAATAADLAAGATTTTEKIDLIYAWVQQRCHYLGLYSGSDGIIPKAAQSVYKMGSGDCKGLATLLIGMLRSTGVEAYPVLALTASGGRLAEDVPNMTQFNHFIAWADTGNGGIFLDATVDRYPAGAIPLVDAESRVLLLKPGAVELVTIPAAACEMGRGQRTVTGRLDDLGRAQFQLTYHVTEGLARYWRGRLSDTDTQTAQKAMLSYLVPAEFPCRAETATLTGLDDWRAPVSMSVALTSSRPLPQAGGTIFVPHNMTGDMLLANAEVICGGRLDLRQHPERQVSWALELPAGYTVTAPDSVVFAGPGLHWVRRCWQDGQIFHLEREIKYTKDYLSPAEADSLAGVLPRIRAAEAGYFEVRGP